MTEEGGADEEPNQGFSLIPRPQGSKREGTTKTIEKMIARRLKWSREKR
jgi:hypothetical protein